MDPDKSYKDSRFTDDTVFNSITKHHISLQDKDIRKNNNLLREIITNGLIPLMKYDDLFKDMYKNINYAGSYFKGTKVGKPDEYDLDLAIRLPLNYKTLQVESDNKHCGFVKIKVGADSKLPKWETHRKILDKWLDNEGYLDQCKFHRWMEGIMQKTYDYLVKIGKEYQLTVANKTYILKQFKKSGPAFTIYIRTENDPSYKSCMDVDLVPCLEFDDIKLKNYRTVPDTSKKMIVVAKPISHHLESNRLWRLSFYEQEKQILLNKENGKIKPIIRMMKKFRDHQQWKQIVSYYIETLFLHELDKRKEDSNFLRTPQTSLFMHMLRKLREVLFTKRLEYFWHKNYNLLDKIEDVVILNYANRLNKILNDIEKKLCGNRFIIAEQILGVRVTHELILIVNSPAPVRSEKDDERANDKVDDLKIEPLKSITTSSSADSVEQTSIEKRIEQVCDKVDDLKIEPSKSITTPSSTDSVEQTSIEKRIEQVCDNLNEILKIKDELSVEQLEKLQNLFKEFTESKNEVENVPLNKYDF